MSHAGAFRVAATVSLLLLAGCAQAGAPVELSPALYTTWGVQPYQMRPDGLLLNGLTPVDPMEHF